MADQPDLPHPPDLDAVGKAIRDAHVAEDALIQTMPNAIHPDEADYPGMVPVDADPQEAAEEVAQQPAPPEETGTEQLEDEVFDADDPQHSASEGSAPG